MRSLIILVNDNHMDRKFLHLFTIARLQWIQKEEKKIPTLELASSEPRIFLQKNRAQLFKTNNVIS